MELLIQALPTDKDCIVVDLITFIRPARKCVHQLLDLV
jgi:hypothetical protein